jgi:hypothetical protein
MRKLLLMLLSALCLMAKAPSRNTLADSEKYFDNTIRRKWADDPLVLLGNTRTIYIEGVGVVITAEINLATGPTVGPFNPNISKEAIAQHREKKLARLPQLRTLMKESLAQLRQLLPELRDDEMVVLGVSLLRYGWEDPTGIPSQIVMRTKKLKTAPVEEQEY